MKSLNPLSLSRDGVAVQSLKLQGKTTIQTHNYDSILKVHTVLVYTCTYSLLTRGAWAATGYSSRLVCLFVCDR